MYARAPRVQPPADPRGVSGRVPSALTVQAVPVLLSFDGYVWGFSGWLLDTPTTLLVKVGSLRASLGSTSAPVPRDVYERAGDRSERYVTWSGNDYQIYRPLTRVVNGRPYRMVTATPVRDWGAWPVWPPAAGPYPSSAARFDRSGVDEYGRPTFTKPGISLDKGFASAPDLGGGDSPNPVPKWTWWQSVK